MHSFKNKLKRMIGDDTIYIAKDIINRVSPSKVYLADLEDRKIKKIFYSKYVKNGDTFFDVGANVGNRIAPLLELGARVVAFEPQRSCRKILKWRFGNKMILVPKALGENDGNKELHISNFSGISSISTEWIDSVKNTRFKNWHGRLTPLAR